MPCFRPLFYDKDRSGLINGIIANWRFVTPSSREADLAGPRVLGGTATSGPNHVLLEAGH